MKLTPEQAKAIGDFLAWHVTPTQITDEQEAALKQRIADKLMSALAPTFPDNPVFEKLILITERVIATNPHALATLTLLTSPGEVTLEARADAIVKYLSLC